MGVSRWNLNARLLKRNAINSVLGKWEVHVRGRVCMGPNEMSSRCLEADFGVEAVWQVQKCQNHVYDVDLDLENDVSVQRSRNFHWHLFIAESKCLVV